MEALVFDKSKYSWENSKGFEKVTVADPVIDEKKNPQDSEYVIIKVKYAGVCGSDRGIWNRTAFGSQILDSLKKEGKNYRIIGHEFFGEVVAHGSAVESIAIGDMVSCESHVICRKCFQCLNDQENVCANQLILGISHDGGFAEFAKVPWHVVWKTDISKIRPEIASIQEPFGNAVHAASKKDLKNKTVVIFGLGPIGLFLLLIARGLGAKTIIGVDPNKKALKMARELGIDEAILLKEKNQPKEYSYSPEIIQKVNTVLSGKEADVAFEMSGFNESVNNSIKAVRRGGDVILFGLKAGDFMIQDFSDVVMRGVTLHFVAGRQIWKTWETTKKILEDRSLGIQDKLWNVILEKGGKTILPFKEYTKDLFEKKMSEHTKVLLKF